MDLDFFKSRHQPVTVGKVIVKDGDREETISITCFVDSGTLFMDGRFAPAYFTIRETLNWYLGDSITDMDIEGLFFDNSDMRGEERPAYSWERRTFLLGHWKQYAKNSTKVKVVIRLDDPELSENESIYLTIPERLHNPSSSSSSSNYEQPPILHIQPFS